MPRVTAAYRERQTDRILQAAEECFARSGFQAASMDEVIAAAGMSSSTVYRYFPEGKRSLIRAVLTRRMGPLAERIKRIAESDEPLDFERDFIEALTLLNYQRHGAAAGSEADRALAGLMEPTVARSTDRTGRPAAGGPPRPARAAGEPIARMLAISVVMMARNPLVSLCGESVPMVSCPPF